MPNSRLFFELKMRLLRLFLGKVAFLFDDSYQVKICKENKFTLSLTSLKQRSWVLVVARSHYFESVKDYPIGNLNDLKNVLKNESWRFPFAGLRFNKIERLSDQTHRVTSWIVKQAMLDNLDFRPLWVIPESACAEILDLGETVAIERLGETLHIAKTPDGLISTLGHADLFFQRLGQESPEGDFGGSQLVKLSGSEAIKSMIGGVGFCLIKSPLMFFRGIDRSSFREYPWQIALKLSAIACTIYLVSTSAFLMLADFSAGLILEGKAKEVESSISIREQIGLSQNLADKLHEVLATSAPLWIAWDVLVDLKTIGVSYRAVNSAAGKVTYYLTAQRAVDVLGWLIEDPRIASAEFTLPIREIRGLEQFAIEVTFHPMALDLGNLEHNTNATKISRSALSRDSLDFNREIIKTDIQGEANG